MIKIDIRPLSVNEAWQGRRFKTPQYKAYEYEMLYRLPMIKLPDPPYEIKFRFGINSRSDWDNPIKPLQDILQQKYGFNDKDVLSAIVQKVVVPVGQEFLEFDISHYEK